MTTLAVPSILKKNLAQIWGTQNQCCSDLFSILSPPKKYELILETPENLRHVQNRAPQQGEKKARLSLWVTFVCLKSTRSFQSNAEPKEKPMQAGKEAIYMSRGDLHGNNSASEGRPCFPLSPTVRPTRLARAARPNARPRPQTVRRQNHVFVCLALQTKGTSPNLKGKRVAYFTESVR